jgi:hypothetical protein
MIRKAVGSARHAVIPVHELETKSEATAPLSILGVTILCRMTSESVFGFSSVYECRSR